MTGKEEWDAEEGRGGRKNEGRKCRIQSEVFEVIYSDLGHVYCVCDAVTPRHTTPHHKNSACTLTSPLIYRFISLMSVHSTFTTQYKQASKMSQLHGFCESFQA
jgi:hypothetical protein